MKHCSSSVLVVISLVFSLDLHDLPDLLDELCCFSTGKSGTSLQELLFDMTDEPLLTWGCIMDFYGVFEVPISLELHGNSGGPIISNHFLVGGLEPPFYFPMYWVANIMPIDELEPFSEGFFPSFPTTFPIIVI